MKKFGDSRFRKNEKKNTGFEWSLKIEVLYFHYSTRTFSNVHRMVESQVGNNQHLSKW